MNNNFYKLPQIQNRLFDNCILLPTANELFELELANLEYELMTKEEVNREKCFFRSGRRRINEAFQILL